MERSKERDFKQGCKRKYYLQVWRFSDNTTPALEYRAKPYLRTEKWSNLYQMAMGLINIIGNVTIQGCTPLLHGRAQRFGKGV